MLTDTHCHLTMTGGGPDAAVEESRAAGVTTIITVGTNLASSAECVQIASTHDGVHAAVGIHPNDSIESTEGVLKRISDLAAHPAVVGVGETGLDWFREGAPRIRQEESFRAHIRIARDVDRTVIIHDRDAHDDVVRVLRSEKPLPPVVFHCFSGGPELVEICAGEGWFMSFAGNVTFKNAGALREAAARVPPELLLTETDSPFLSPHPHRGKPNLPARVVHTVSQLAELHDRDAEDMARITSANARRAFALPAADDVG